jgi:c(7)-type cytochrome triheme protein
MQRATPKGVALFYYREFRCSASVARIFFGAAAGELLTALPPVILHLINLFSGGFLMRGIIGIIAAVLLAGASIAMAVPSGKVLEFTNNSEGIVKFDGEVHSKAGAVCKDCHNPEVFPKMKQGAVQITMDEIYAGKQCGACHNGQKAFEAKTNCQRCHIAP